MLTVSTETIPSNGVGTGSGAISSIVGLMYAPEVRRASRVCSGTTIPFERPLLKAENSALAAAPQDLARVTVPS